VATAALVSTTSPTGKTLPTGADPIAGQDRGRRSRSEAGQGKWCRNGRPSVSWPTGPRAVFTAPAMARCRPFPRLPRPTHAGPVGFGKGPGAASRNGKPPFLPVALAMAAPTPASGWGRFPGTGGQVPLVGSGQPSVKRPRPTGSPFVRRRPPPPTASRTPQSGVATRTKARPTSAWAPLVDDPRPPRTRSIRIPGLVMCLMV